jgi:hypothetical protein
MKASRTKVAIILAVIMSSASNVAYARNGRSSGKADQIPPRISVTYEKPGVDNYRLDWCLTWGGGCGEPAARAFCELTGHDQLEGFEKDPNIGKTLVLDDNRICRQRFCDSFTYIACSGR